MRRSVEVLMTGTLAEKWPTHRSVAGDRSGRYAAEPGQAHRPAGDQQREAAGGESPGDLVLDLLGRQARPKAVVDRLEVLRRGRLEVAAAGDACDLTQRLLVGRDRPRARE